MSKPTASLEALDERLKGVIKLMETNHQHIAKEFEGLNKKADYTNGQVMENTNFRLKTIGVISFAKFIGITNILALGTLVIEVFFK